MTILADALREFVGVELHLALTYFLCVCLGVVINWAKRSHEAGISIWAYWTQHPIRSQTALFATFSAFAFTLVTDPESSKLSYVAIGFAFDNLLSKNEVNQTHISQLEEVAALQAQLKRELQDGTN